MVLVATATTDTSDCFSLPTPAGTPAPIGSSTLTGIVQLMLSSLNTVNKKSPLFAGWFAGSAPNPRLGPAVELPGGERGGLLDLGVISERLSGQRLAA